MCSRSIKSGCGCDMLQWLSLSLCLNTGFDVFSCPVCQLGILAVARVAGRRSQIQAHGLKHMIEVYLGHIQIHFCWFMAEINVVSISVVKSVESQLIAAAF